MPYYSWEDVKPQAGKQEVVMSMIQNQEVDFMLCGGARAGGKSELLSMMPLLFSDDSQYRGIFFRRQYDEIMGANGLWQKAQNMYHHFKAAPNKTDKTWTFPSGAIQEYRHLYHDGGEESHRGKGYSMVGFDEIDQFTPAQVRMLMTCLRSEAAMDSFCVGTLNPNPDSWCLPLVEYYLNKDGSPNEDKCGEIRWYVLKDDEFLFGPSEQWFKDNHPDTVYVTIPGKEEAVYVRPKRFTYVFFNVFDNPAFLAINPTYLSELYNLPDHERASQLYGNWYTREKGRNIFRIGWLEETDHIPVDGICVRAWDKAYSDNLSSYPDFTASVKMYKDANGIHYLCGDYKEDLTDDFKAGEDIIYGRFRKLAGQRDQWMLAQAEEDGDDCLVVIPEEGGAGKGEYQQMTKMFVNEGFRVKGIKTGNVKGAKLKRFASFTSAAQNGLIKVVPSSFGNTATYKAFVKELENFTGEKSTGLLKDDWVDAVSDAFAACQKNKVFKVPSIPDISSSNSTLLAQHRQRVQ